MLEWTSRCLQSGTEVKEEEQRSEVTCLYCCQTQQQLLSVPVLNKLGWTFLDYHCERSSLEQLMEKNCICEPSERNDCVNIVCCRC